MGSIQNKRGSVRGAPPDVYMPFFSVPENSETDAAFRFAGLLFVFIVGLIFTLGLIGYGLEAIGLWKAN